MVNHFRECIQARWACARSCLYLTLCTCSMRTEIRNKPFVPPSTYGEQLLHNPSRLGKAPFLHILAESGKKTIRRLIAGLLWSFGIWVQWWCHWCTSRFACGLCCFLGISPIPSKTEEFSFLHLEFLVNIQRNTPPKSSHSAWNLFYSDGDTRLAAWKCHLASEKWQKTLETRLILKFILTPYHLFLNTWISVMKTVALDRLNSITRVVRISWVKVSSRCILFVPIKSKEKHQLFCFVFLSDDIHWETSLQKTQMP